MRVCVRVNSMSSLKQRVQCLPPCMSASIHNSYTCQRPCFTWTCVAWLLAVRQVIANLRHLRRLILYGNQIFDIPVELSACQRIEELNLFNNRAIRMPSELSEIRTVVDVNFAGNRLKTAVFPEEWTFLRRLCLSWNQMVILPSIEPLQELVCLQLNDNCLTALPAGLAALTKLEVLDVSMNEIAEIDLDVFLHLVALTAVNLRQNCLRQLPSSIGVLKNLVTLNVGCNRLSYLPSSVGLCKQLHVLVADNNRMEALPPGTICDLATAHGVTPSAECIQLFQRGHADRCLFAAIAQSRQRLC